MRARVERLDRTSIRDRNGVIDAYRGIAVLGVMAFHFLCRWSPPFAPSADLYHYDRAYAPEFALGQYGVHLFFVISGLVITMTVLRCKTSLEFLARRFARLFPALFVCSMLTLAIVDSIGPAVFHRTAIDWLTSLTLDPEHLGRQSIDNAYWSLLVEVKFYLWVALFFQLLGPRFWIGLVALGFAAIPLHSAQHSVAGYLVPLFMPLFLIGVSAWQLLFERDRMAGIIVGIAAVVLYAGQLPGYVDLPMFPDLKPFGEIGLTAAIALILLTIRLPAPLWLAPLSTIGRWSYALYLLHQNIGVSLIHLAKAAGATDVVAIAVSVSIVVGLARLVHEWVELPGQAAVMHGYRAFASRRLASAGGESDGASVSG
jgi:peptidoglycan/LPS O-acetylase OafA/YrhL